MRIEDFDELDEFWKHWIAADGDHGHYGKVIGDVDVREGRV